jgi:penicillin G amidase
VLSRLFLIISSLAALVISASLLFWYLAYGSGTSSDEKLSVEGLSEMVSLDWSREQSVHITASTTADFMIGLGFAHASARTWEMLLYRQTALGRLSEWFGEATEEQDLLMRILQIGSSARNSYFLLSSDDRTLLDRYADGINAALGLRRVGRNKAMVLLDLQPDRWEPWHSIAVERLWAWIGTRNERTTPTKGVAEKNFSSLIQNADDALRSRLHLFGFQNSVVATGNDEILFRYVLGNSGSASFQPFSAEIDGNTLVRGLSVPGSIMVPVGQRDSLAWGYLLTSSLNRRPISAHDLRVRTSYDRMVTGEGSEREIRILRMGTDLPLLDPDRRVSAGNVELLRWSGLRIMTDTPRWLSLLTSRKQSTDTHSTGLFDFAGAQLVPGSLPSVSGPPAWIRNLEFRWSVVSPQQTRGGSVDRLDDLVRNSNGNPGLEVWKDNLSLLAERNAGHVHSVLDADSSLSASERNALDYMDNWDFRYDPSSIAGSILESMVSVADRPLESIDDPVLMRSVLSRSLSRLGKRFGSDMSAWRWETIQNRTLFNPGWNVREVNDDARRSVRSFQNAFLPVRTRGIGHPSTMMWGSRIVPDEDQWKVAPSDATVAVSGVLSARTQTLEFQLPSIDWSVFLGQFTEEIRPVEYNLSAYSRDYGTHQSLLIPDR